MREFIRGIWDPSAQTVWHFLSAYALCGFLFALFITIDNKGMAVLAVILGVVVLPIHWMRNRDRNK